MAHRGLGWEFHCLFHLAEPVAGIFRRGGERWLACGKMRVLVPLLESPQISRKTPGEPQISSVHDSDLSH